MVVAISRYHDVLALQPILVCLLKVKQMVCTIYSDTKGRSYKSNLPMNQEPHLDSNSQAVLREKGVIPATIGILKGQVHATCWSDGIFETLIDLVDFGCLVFGHFQNWKGWRLDDGKHIGRFLDFCNVYRYDHPGLEYEVGPCPIGKWSQNWTLLEILRFSDFRMVIKP